MGSATIKENILKCYLSYTLLPWLSIYWTHNPYYCRVCTSYVSYWQFVSFNHIVIWQLQRNWFQNLMLEVNYVSPLLQLITSSCKNHLPKTTCILIVWQCTVPLRRNLTGNAFAKWVQKGKKCSLEANYKRMHSSEHLLVSYCIRISNDSRYKNTCRWNNNRIGTQQNG